MGIDIGATTIAGGLVTGAGDVLEVVQVRTHGGGPGTAVEALFGVVDTLLAKSAARGLPLLPQLFRGPAAADQQSQRPEAAPGDGRHACAHERTAQAIVTACNLFSNERTGKLAQHREILS